SAAALPLDRQLVVAGHVRGQARLRKRHRFVTSAAALPLDRQLVVAAPLVPGAGVVAGVVARAAEGERRERRPRAGVAVRDHLGALGRADELADPLGRLRLPGRGEELVHLDALRPADVALARVAGAAALARVLLLAPHVE